MCEHKNLTKLLESKNRHSACAPNKKHEAAYSSIYEADWISIHVSLLPYIYSLPWHIHTYHKLCQL